VQQFDATIAHAISYHIVTAAIRSFWKALLHGLAWVLFAVAGLTFWAGGKLISEFAKMDRILAEMLGFMIAFALGAVGYVLKNFGDDLGSDQDSPSQ
jgi:hypothetical protein